MVIHSVAFIVGSCWASFINTMVWRHGLVIKHPGPWRSHCDHCHHPLRIWQLIPILGWVLQLGRCYDCHCRLSNWPPLCELVIGILATCLIIQSWINIIFISIAISCMLIISSQDHYEQGFSWLFLLGILPLIFLRPPGLSWMNDCCVIVGVLPLYFYRKFGNGDCDLIIIMIMILGYQAAAYAIMAACLLACCHPALYRGQAIAFAPCLNLELAGSVVLPALLP